ncbi:PREDICTED: uncharacterized protein LOC104743752 [Camelina sativa]|uniref:Uncharacterized protein LOC104743752 n=1 Tax=Camelina sativa TaxID=90675 RepID=A0ABM0VYJ8_CAMSA|nr:PREDICTED: uncharacterized protein LOC104743752 [Camelina sativa]
MEPNTDGTGTSKNIMLDTKRYGYWKVRMTQLIIGQGEDAWTAVEEGWEPPFDTTEDGVKIPKPKARWTIDEKNLSKFNARAMNAIFSGVDEDEFKLIQGCKSAKQVWDILQQSHEGTSTVKRTRLDMLATQFECLKMAQDETIVKFSSKLSAITNEAEVLGKTYKDQKLVKKLLRCLPSKFAAHKAVMRVAGNTESMTFSELVGLLKSEEMEADEDKAKPNFGKALKKVERNNNRDTRRWSTSEGDKPVGRSSQPDVDYSAKRKEIQCYECGGYGHIKPECLVTKRNELKCLECKGMGHTNDSESDEEGEELLNFVAFTVNGDNVQIGADYDSESDEEINPKEEYRILYDSWVHLSKDKLKLIQEKPTLESKLESAYEDATEKVNHTPLKANDQSTEGLLHKLSNLLEEYYKEKGRATVLEKELNEKHKQIRMLNSGTKDLDKILPMGRIDATHRGLGHLEKEADISTNLTKEISVIKRSEKRQNHSLKDYHKRVIRRRTYGCDHCGGNHQRGHCYSFRKKINLLWNLNKCYLEPAKFCSVWISKKDLYSDLYTEKSNLNLMKMYDEDDEIYSRGNLKTLPAVSGEDSTENISLSCNPSLIELEEDDVETNVAYTSTDSSEVKTLGILIVDAQDI